MNEIGYIEAVGIYYPGALSKIRKSDNLLQPIFEAFTNSLESIRLLKERHKLDAKQSITISLYFTKNLFSKENFSYNFQKVVIEDTGIGFDDIEFQRLIALNNNEKGFSNKGTGRVQYLHSFNKTLISSSYIDKSSSTGYRSRVFTLSKSEPFLKKNAIIRIEEGNGEVLNTDKSSTILTFENILKEQDTKFYNLLTAEELRDNILKHYLGHFCENREDLPEIVIRKVVGNDILKELQIKSEDIPIPNEEKDVDVYYSKIGVNGIEKTSNKEILKLKAFKLPKEKLDKNDLILVSKGELASRIKLENLLANDQIDGNRYLFLLSGDYINQRDSDTRGKIDIIKRKDLKKRDEIDLFESEEILLEDIEDKTNSTILEIYNEIKMLNESQKKNIRELQRMFLLNPKTVNSLKKKIGVNDSDDTILRKVYEADAKIIAEGDAELKKQIKELSSLNTSKPDYKEKLREQVDELVKAIPIQNRTALTHYVARRKLILELFDKIIKKQLDIQKQDSRNIDEKLLHNLIFQQSSDNTETSDLWLLNEDYIYFNGTSEGQLGKILIDGNNILKESLSEEEEIYKLKQQGDATQRRPDILLFPKEGKCIIIEFKSLDTNISEHLNQINRYASLINNLSQEKYNFHTYYGYLIGENIDIDDIEDNDSDFKSAHKLNYIFRPYKRISGKFNKKDGALYTEIIKYSTLLERAMIRNKIFIEKLTKPIK
ncbi:hypothetical protein [Aquimarina megaterium]|uniref:hypothetical protein n=1 Tax=Aquimarina megaterium TaxID=1443666 RepID=UPI000944504D|nr:hypothetical protein [Aquimarina megaterium]